MSVQTGRPSDSAQMEVLAARAGGQAGEVCSRSSLMCSSSVQAQLVSSLFAFSKKKKVS